MNSNSPKTAGGQTKIDEANKLKAKKSHLGFQVMIASGGIMWLCFAAITLLGPAYDFDVEDNNRPIMLVTGLFIATSLLSLVALWSSLKTKRLGKDSFWVLVLFAIAFRFVQLFAPPFQELDLYRYMWDGIVVSHGHSPYRFSPQQANGTDSNSNPELKRIRTIATRSESTHTILSRVHFAKYTTIYPPTSQLVFAATMAIVPRHASVAAYLFAMKTVVTLFDLGTAILIAYLLLRLKLHLGWLIVYAWNPLVIKEFANSGHLDSIAVFFVMAAAVFLVKFLAADRNHDDGSNSPIRNATKTQWTHLFLSAQFLGLGFGSKIYPIIFVPLFFATIWRISDLKRASAFALIFGLVGGLSFLPMWMEINRTKESKRAVLNQTTRQVSESDQPLDITLSDTNPKDHLRLETSGSEQITNRSIDESQEGLSEFLRKWQMNELIFMIAFQNLRPIDENRTLDVPWFRVLNEHSRDAVCKWGANFVSKQESPNLISRMITLGLFATAYGFVLYYLFKATTAGRESHIQFLSNCFWIVAVFFCLQPTQNPWYWTWAIPFLTFCRNRAWLAYTPLLLVYYFRFWFRELPGEYNFFGFTYTGTGLFDYCVVWLEHAPVFVAIILLEGLHRYRERQSTL